MTYDSVRDLLWLYNNSRVTAYKNEKMLFSLSDKDLEKLGINSIQKIIADNKYGNIFLLENGRLIMFTQPGLPYQNLYDDYVLNDAKIFLKGDLLITAGSFGVLFSKILGSGKITSPVFYPNIKELHYKDVYDLQVSAKEVTLNTDKGPYTVSIPDERRMNDKSSINSWADHKFILFYNNRMTEVGENDTVQIEQKNTKLQFDIIKPNGWGKPEYSYRLDNNTTSSWHVLNANELNLPPLAPGQYYSLRIKVSDDQWRSRPRNVTLYIVPYWWQRPLAHQLIVVSLVLGILLLVIAIVGITKKIVTRNNAKKNLQLELELKSIYSQINPHFIFNSLSAAMYLMKINKIDDAHAHIHKFSDLLRSYIKSSRNRFIKINEEITNLKNYIELQQTRFKNKFDYEIVVDEQLDQDARIPSLLLQPLVENAIIHGLLQRESKGQLKITFSKGISQNEIVCAIDDNGIGRRRSKEENSKRTVKQDSYGEQLIKDLTGILNKYMKMNIEIIYIDKEAPMEGTRVVIRIKENTK